MRISIIGPSGSGKTYLAKKLAEKYNIAHANLDYVFYKHFVEKDREQVPESEWKRNLNNILDESDWVVEGINPIIGVFEKADKIIYLRPSIVTALFRQWKRYFTDPKQRGEHGFRNNLKLSGYLFKQYTECEDAAKKDDPMYFRVSKVDRVLRSYSSKLVVLRTKDGVRQYLAS